MRTLCRLSVLYRQPLSAVMDWPAAHVAMLGAYLARQPAPDERIEISIAGLRELVSNYLRAKGSRRATVADFLPYRDPWNEHTPSATDERYSDVDREVLAAFG